MKLCRRDQPEARQHEEDVMHTAKTPSGARMALLILVASGLAFAWALASVRPAHAEISGPCGATLNGVDVAGVNSGDRGDDISVSNDATVPVTMTSTTGFKSHKIQLEFGGIRWTVSDKQDDGSTSWSDSANVKDYAKYGVGLYKVIGVATLVDGTKCTGAATVDVSGNPLTTVAGAVAVTTVAVGTAGAAASTAMSARGTGGLSDIEDMVKDAWKEEQEKERQAAAETDARLERALQRLVSLLRDFQFAFPWFGCGFAFLLTLLMLPFMAVTGGSGGAPAGEPAPRTLPRVHWRPRATGIGLVSGFIAGVGLAVLLQQYSIDYPTRTAIIRDVVAGLLLYGIVLPTLGQTLAVRRVNGRIAELEQRVSGKLT
jgi:hypothetical protein